jgi:hypothetical protein
MDGNGTPELILLTKYTVIRAVFTVKGLTPVLLESSPGKGGFFYFASGGRFFLRHKTENGSIEEYTHFICRVDGDKMVYDSVYGSVIDRDKQEYVEFFHMVNGERTTVDQAAYNELNREMSRVTNIPGLSDSFKLEAPYIHLPLVEPVSTENLPVADFSDYEAIRETYKTISNCVEDFNETEWKV